MKKLILFIFILFFSNNLFSVEDDFEKEDRNSELDFFRPDESKLNYFLRRLNSDIRQCKQHLTSAPTSSTRLAVLLKLQRDIVESLSALDV